MRDKTNGALSRLVAYTPPLPCSIQCNLAPLALLKSWRHCRCPLRHCLHCRRHHRRRQHHHKRFHQAADASRRVPLRKLCSHCSPHHRIGHSRMKPCRHKVQRPHCNPCSPCHHRDPSAHRKPLVHCPWTDSPSPQHFPSGRPLDRPSASKRTLIVNCTSCGASAAYALPDRPCRCQLPLALPCHHP